ncbi:alpha-glucosidase C-terminal domain-containing protein [Patescibacteria group bacterium]|nr:alpha-glucosidase C-terminal domain-containing protein [Patescibacteria group bacterium]
MSKTKQSQNFWWKSAIIYQIYPRSFKDTNNNGIGDLKGIIKKLDYLNDGTENSLGIDAIWLSPIYKSPMADYGYDVSDYNDIDPIFGNLNDFNQLVNEAHQRNIKIIMDFIPNHTSNQHSWFLESRSALDNPKRDWYIWCDPQPDGSPPNNWISVFGGPAWTYDQKTKQYYLHSFLSEQPDLNWRNSEVVKEMHNVLRFWMEKGVDGFRIDALYHLIKDDKFRNEPHNPAYQIGKSNPYDEMLHIYSNGQPELISAINGFCRVLSEKPGHFMIGEMYLDIKEMAKFYQACSNQLHLPTNFSFINLPWQAQNYKEFVDQYEQILGTENWPNYVLGNHDQSRVVTRIGNRQSRVAAMLILTLRGMPFIYYGEELGMENTHIPKGKICDPCGEQDSIFGRDPERTPMHWNSNRYAGFSTKQPWLPVNHNFSTYNVVDESKDSQSMLNLYRRLIWYRKRSTALLAGEYHSLKTSSKNIFAYFRQQNQEKILVVLNFSDQSQSIKIDIDDQEAKLILSTYLDYGLGKMIKLKNFVLRSNEGILLEL